MSLAVILEIIVGILKFPGEVSAFIRLISKSPEEKRQEILKNIEIESRKLDREGRPGWDDYPSSP